MVDPPSVRVVPKQESFLTAEELEDEENEFVFVQHGVDLNRDLLEQSVRRYLEGRRPHRCELTEIELQNAVYPVAFDGNGFLVSRPVDRYLFANTT
jgi:hypothetical protein